MCNQCTTATGPSEHEQRQQLLDYAWNYFAYHAGQRVNMFNYSLVAASLLAAGVAGAVVNEEFWVAAPLCLVGAVVATSFWRIDCRNSSMVDRSEEALEALEAAMFPTGANALKGRKKDANGHYPDLIGIMREDSRRHPDRLKWGETKSIPKWAAGYARDLKFGKHGVHLRLIEILICLVFLAGGFTALFDPDLLRAQKKDEDTAQITGAVDKVSDALRGLDAGLTNLNSTVAQAATRAVSPVALPAPAAPPTAGQPPAQSKSWPPGKP